MENKTRNVYTTLDRLGLSYTVCHHPPVATVVEADAVFEKYPQLSNIGHTKNLFLSNKKGDNHYLFIAEAHSSFNLSWLSGVLKESRLSFASERRLNSYLGAAPGSVSLFSLLNDTEKLVKVVVDDKLLEYSSLGFHPNHNETTVIITKEGMEAFLKEFGYEPIYIRVFFTQ